MFYLDLFSALDRHQVDGAVPVIVASIDDLIALKQAVGRPIDLTDIEHLQRLKASENGV